MGCEQDGLLSGKLPTVVDLFPAYTYLLTYVLCGFTHACDLFYIVYITV